jgi:hypothetical protein
MPKNILEIAIKLTKEGGGDKDAIAGLVNLKKSITELVAVGGSIAAVGTALYKFGSESVDTYINLTDSVKKFHQMTGMSAESSSRLIEVFSDLGVSQDKVTTAMKFAEKNGFQPTIESILTMQQQYLKLNEGQERTEFLLKNFGKSGVDLQPFFEMGNIAERLQDVGVGKIITEEDIQAAQEYKDALDDLKDAEEEFKAEAGRKITPWWTDVIKGLTGSMEVQQKATMSRRDYINLINLEKAPIDSATQSYMAQAQAIEETASATSDLAAAQAGVSGTGPLATVEDFKSLLDFSGKYMDIQDKISAKEAEIAIARKQGYADTGTKMSGLKDELSGLQAQEEQFMNQFLLQMLMMSGVPADTLMVIAQGMGLISQKTVDAYTGAKNLADEIAKIPENQRATFEWYVKLTGDGEKAYKLMMYGSSGGASTGGGMYTMGQTSGNAIAQAAGGPLAPIAMVGEQGWEFVINGVVIPHAASVLLAQAGIIGSPMSTGGFVQAEGGYATGGTVPAGVTRTTTGAGAGRTGGTDYTTTQTGSADKSDYSYGVTTVTPATVAAQVSTATAETIAPVAATMQAATAATIAIATQTQAAIQNMTDAQQASTDSLVSAIKDQAGQIANIVVDAVRQVIQYNA